MSIDSIKGSRLVVGLFKLGSFDALLSLKLLLNILIPLE
jgi:hypothetical protein